MSNVVRLFERVPRRAESKIDLPKLDPVPMTALAQIDRVQHVSKENVKAAILLLAQSSVRAQQIISQIKDDESRERLSAHAGRIRELVEIAARRAAQL